MLRYRSMYSVRKDEMLNSKLHVQYVRKGEKTK